MATVRISQGLASVEELEAIERITDVAFWQLMLVDDLGHARFLVECLVRALRDRLDEIVDSSARIALEELGGRDLADFPVLR